MSPRLVFWEESAVTQATPQVNWDAIPPAGQDDILGLVVFAYSMSPRRRSGHTSNSTSQLGCDPSRWSG
jgi:hypothetical protein